MGVVTIPDSGLWEDIADDINENNVLLGTQEWDFVKPGVVNTAVILSTDSDFTTPSGRYIMPTGDFELVGLVFTAGSGSSIQATSVTVRVATMPKDSGTQFSFGSGTTIKSQSMLVATGTALFKYGKAESVFFTGVPITNDEILHIEMTPVFWSLADVRVKAIVREV